MERRERIVQYDADFDTNEYDTLLDLRQKDIVLFEEKRRAQDGFTKFNLETAIGERFNAGLSQRRDEIVDGEIVDTHKHQPLLAMIKNGVAYRKKHGSSPSDQIREHAEVTGFEKIQKILANPFTPVGTMMVSFSPPGEGDSIYKHNFYDVFTLKEDGKRRYVDARRYSSGLTLSEYKEKIRDIRPDYFEDTQEERSFTPADFLANPFELRNGIDADTLHANFHKDHAYMDNREYQEIIRLCQPFIHAYLNQLAKDPHNTGARNLHFNAILNKADEIVDQRRSGVLVHDVFVRATDAEIYRLGEQDVRQVAAGCGASGGAETNFGADGTKVPFSVAEFGRDSDRHGSLEFSCPHKGCGKVNRRSRNQLIENCQHCGKSVRC